MHSAVQTQLLAVMSVAAENNTALVPAESFPNSRSAAVPRRCDSHYPPLTAPSLRAPPRASHPNPLPPPLRAQQHDVTPERSAQAQHCGPSARAAPPREQLGAVPTMPRGAARSAPSWRRPPQLAQLAQPRRPPPLGPAAPEPRAPLGLQHERRQRGRLLGTRPLRRLLRDLRAGHRDRSGAGRALR